MSAVIKRSKNKIVFYYPHRQVVSGGLFYFYYLAYRISLLDDYEVFVVNYKNSKFTIDFLVRYPDSKINFIDYEYIYIYSA